MSFQLFEKSGLYFGNKGWVEKTTWEVKNLRKIWPKIIINEMLKRHRLLKSTLSSGYTLYVFSVSVLLQCLWQNFLLYPLQLSVIKCSWLVFPGASYSDLFQIFLWVTSYARFWMKMKWHFGNPLCRIAPELFLMCLLIKFSTPKEMFNQ